MKLQTIRFKHDAGSNEQRYRDSILLFHTGRRVLQRRGNQCCAGPRIFQNRAMVFKHYNQDILTNTLDGVKAVTIEQDEIDSMVSQ